jgi:hypothetical protein
VNDPRSPEPRTAAGRRLLDLLNASGIETLLDVPVEDRIALVEEQASSSDELRAALETFFDEKNGRWQYHDEFAHVPLYELDALRAALSSKPSAEPEKPA